MKPAPRKFLNWLRRALLWMGAATVALLIAGRIYQTAATQADKEKFPPPGMLVNVDGYQMHIYCTGQGSPTILLDHVADGSSVDWALIQPELAMHTRVCAYDRTGHGWSEYNPAPRTLEQEAQELRRLLLGANEQGPYLLVGHSHGALVSRAYAARYPNEVLGMVLMDPGMNYDDPRYPQEAKAKQESDAGMIRTLKNLAPYGFVRIMLPIVGPPSYDLPESARLADASFRATESYWKSLKDLGDNLPVVFEEERHLTMPGDIPLLILMSTEPDDATQREWIDASTEMAQLSTQGRHQIVQGATHISLAYRKNDAQVSTDGILSILETVRTRLAR